MAGSVFLFSHVWTTRNNRQLAASRTSSQVLPTKEWRPTYRRLLPVLVNWLRMRPKLERLWRDQKFVFPRGSVVRLVRAPRPDRFTPWYHFVKRSFLNSILACSNESFASNRSTSGLIGLQIRRGHRRHRADFAWMCTSAVSLPTSCGCLLFRHRFSYRGTESRSCICVFLRKRRVQPINERPGPASTP
jgi:hypothetical protein